MLLNKLSGLYGTVFNVQRYSIHDGPGIRTIVFLKGCPLGCLWCSNPESQLARPEVMQNDEKCLLCLKCIEACSLRVRYISEGSIHVDRDKCIGCGKCADVCPTQAAHLIGKMMSVEEVVAEVELDRIFYEESGGGVTLSGGEPAQQSQFAEALLSSCRDKFLHTAVETTGCAPWETMEKLGNLSDLLLYDLKHIDSKKHLDFTGVGNELILNNLRKLVALGVNITIRVPVIPGFNDSKYDFHRMGSFLQDISYSGILQLLPYHEFGRLKYEKLGRQYLIEGPGLDNEDVRLKKAACILKEYRIETDF